MRRVSVCVFWVGIVGLMTLLSAYSAKAGPPYLTDDPDPVDYKHWEIYIASEYTNNKNYLSGTLPHLDINYGIAPNVQFTVVAPMVYFRPIFGSMQYGYGDTQIGVKWRFMQEGKKQPMVAIFPQLNVPTGDSSRGLGAGSTGFYLPLWIQKSWGPWTTYGGGGFTRNPGIGNKDYDFVGWLLQRSVSKRLTLGAEIFYSTAALVGDPSSTGFNVGGGYDFDEVHHLLFSVGTDFHGPNRGMAYIAYQLTFGPEKKKEATDKKEAAPTPQPPNSYQDDLRIVSKWMTDLQYVDAASPSYGALKVHHTPSAVSAEGKQYFRVSPYITNLGVLGLLHSKSANSLTIAERWITWFTAHLTPQSAPDGVPFEHFYLADGSGETLCVKPGDHFLCRYNDATDSAAATFFSVLLAYAQAGGKRDFLTLAGRKSRMEGMAATMLDLQQKDGLFWAKRDYQVKYLEDNCEVFAGLKSLAELERTVYHDQPKANEYRQDADRTRQGILKELYDPNTGRYFVAKFQDEKRTSPDAGKWYPDMQSQLWPQLWGVVGAKDPKTQAVMNALNRHWDGKSGPDWAATPEKINGGWIDADVAYAALLAGDTDPVVTYLHAVERGKFPQNTPGFAWPYTLADAGWLLQILTRLSGHVPPDAQGSAF